ncbi:MAG TPA: DUF6084 family protein [Gemmataceae bacterium]|nr:DUF6084 family protein [Gemmataceae bacterium]
MPDLSFELEGAEAVPFAAVPMLAFKLAIRQMASSDDLLPIHTVALHCQIRIDPGRRRYGRDEQERLRDLFDLPSQWSRTLRPLLWTHANVVLPPFTDAVTVDLPVPCTFDFNVAATKYFQGLNEGDVPLTLLFSGTVFHEDDEGHLQIAQIPWDKEVTFRLPIGVWREMMDCYYPNTAWLCLRRDVVDRLYEFKRQQGLPSFEAALEGLMPAECVRTT